ncbi:hypothetical protein MBAV_000370 [Candidatus Magnetobacterium bavaricum]|uniref:Uncharacterized protein n=1 Tax=Candidatus Magnetobacterium bavaricum TaxID=29290 RepID=A0A0F3GZV2_9BACT|nr:hypothetical protein MBAV_000370 [Candidatus Magnetobacterium bavaricum]
MRISYTDNACSSMASKTACGSSICCNNVISMNNNSEFVKSYKFTCLNSISTYRFSNSNFSSLYC